MRRFVVIVALIAVLLPGAGRALIELPSIKNKLIELALDQISTPGSFEITVEAIEDRDDGSTSLAGVNVSDGQSVWLTLERLTFNWQPDKLLSGELAISQLELLGLTIARPPSEDAEPPDLKPQQPWAESLFDWPRAPVALSIEGVGLERVAIAEGVLPQAIRFDAEARALDKGDLQDLQLSLRRTDEVAGTIRIAMKRDFDAGTLALELIADEAPGGMVAAAAGLEADKPARLTLQAQGPLTDWQVDFDAAIERVMTAAGRATFSNTGRLAVDADFAVTPGPDLEPELGLALATVLGERAELKARIIQLEGGMIEIVSGHLRSPALNLTASGAYAAGAGESDLTVELEALAPLADLADGVAFERLGFEGRVTGPQGALAANGAISLTGLATGPFDAGALRLDGQASQTDEGATFGLGGTGEALRIDRIGPDVIGAASLRLDGALAGDALTLATFDLSSQALKATASGDYNLAASAGDLTLDFSAPDLRPVAGAYDLAAEGSIAAKLAVSLAQTRVDATLDAALECFVLEAVRAERLALTGTARQESERLTFDLSGGGAGVVVDKIPPGLTQKLDLSLTGSMADETVTLRTLNVTSPLLMVDASGIVGLSQGTLAIDYSATSTELAPVAAAYDVAAGGALEASGRAEGSAGAPRLGGSVSLEAARFQDVDYGDMRLVHDVALGPVPEGRVEIAKTGGAYGDGDAETSFRLEGNRLSLSDTRARGLGAAITGTADLDLGTVLAEAAFDVAVADLRPIGRLAGMPLSGAVQGAIGLGSTEGRQDATADLRLSGVETGPARVGDARVQFAGKDLFGTPGIDLATDASGIAVGAVTLDRARITANGPLSALNFEADAAGTLLENKPLTLALAGRADARGDPAQVNLARLAATAAEDRIELRRPLRLRLGGGLAEARGLDLGLPGDGALTGDLAMQGGGLTGDLALARLPLDILERWAGLPVRAGTMDGTARFRTGAARADLSAQIRGLGFDKNQDAVQNMDADLQAEWAGRSVETRTEVRGDFGEPFRAHATIPVRRGADGLPRPARSGAIAGGVTWRGRLGDLWALVPAPGHVLDGELDIDLGLGGTLAAPSYSGRFNLNDGEYQNLDAGTILTDMTLRTSLAEDGGMRTTVEGSDGTAGGTVRAVADLSAAAGLPAVAATVDIDAATLVRRDDVTAKISGTLGLNGPVDDMLLNGEVYIDKAEVRLINNAPPSVVDLEGIRIKGAPDGDGNGDGDSVLTLDLKVQAKRDIFVRGRGLDSEWGMDLAVTGDAAAPVINGTIERVRGGLDLLGKRFDLARGKITFDGGAQVDPLIDVAIEREDNDLRGGIIVEGRVSKPDIRFASTPALPESEVMPRLLFGQSRQSMTGAQAIQLATGIATLMGSGPGILDGVRGVTGLDVLRVDGETPEDASVTVGRNIGEGIFVGARQGLGGAGSTVTVEVEVFDGVIVDTEVGQEGNSSAGISLRKDF
ncbi:MAG: translocation/assembly module TamB domain-containing protein [Paracoccaceae bacterium]|nr:translocation/assembly module TamB domain-containing protein [Paracoccaceae bacterium]